MYFIFSKPISQKPHAIQPWIEAEAVAFTQRTRRPPPRRLPEAAATLGSDPRARERLLRARERMPGHGERRELLRDGNTPAFTPYLEARLLKHLRGSGPACSASGFHCVL